MMLLARSAWVNRGEAAGEPERLLRNRFLAAWLVIKEPVDDDDLQATLARKLRLLPSEARWLVSTSSGITHYYKAHRPAFRRHLRRHAESVAQALSLVWTKSEDPTDKVRRVASIVSVLPEFGVPRGGRASILNGLTPVLAPLDPQRRFPIMNAKTSRLLACMGEEPDANGAASLTILVASRGKELGLRHSFDLDVYAATHAHRFPPRVRSRLDTSIAKPMDAKSEESIITLLAKRSLTIRRQHNALITASSGRCGGAIDWSRATMTH